MQRLNLILLLALVVCAVGLVTSQHKSRQLVAQNERETSRSRALDVEYGQLQLEQSTWSMHSRIERYATERLQMSAADPKRTQLVPGAPPTPAIPRTLAAYGPAQSSPRGGGE